jgi:hypothetical protein
MEASNSLYIVMPVVITLVLVVLIALPFVGARNPGHGLPSDTHAHWLGSEGQISEGQIPDHSATPKVVGGSVTGPGHAQDDAADDENARGAT